MRCSSVKANKLSVYPGGRRQSTCIGSNANLSARKYSCSPKIERAHSTADQNSIFKEDNNLLNVISRAQSQQGEDYLISEPGPRRIQRAHSHCPGADIRSLKKAEKRSAPASRSSLTRSPHKLYPTTSRRCSEAVALYTATGDLEMARNFLLEARERSLAKSINEGT